MGCAVDEKTQCAYNAEAAAPDGSPIGMAALKSGWNLVWNLPCFFAR